MEVSPRGGGNRIAELQDMATGQKLIKNEILKALNMPLDHITAPKYDGVWCNYILHSSHAGILETVEIDDSFRQQYIKDEGLIVKKGDAIHPFTGANTSLGTLFLRAENRKELDTIIGSIDDFVKIKLV